jgi:beta-lactam-binding protein with PASTA domain
VAGLPSVAAADATLRKAGLTVAAAPKGIGVSAPVHMNAVAGTDPAAGTAVPQNQPVTVEVVAGLALPPLTGQSINAVQQWAGQNQITIQQTPVQSNQPQGIIVSQSPAPNTPVTPGSTVNVSVSQGPPMVPFNNVVGENFQQAQQYLESLGFQVVGKQVFFGQRVDSTSPSGQAPQGSTITVTYGF